MAESQSRRLSLGTQLDIEQILLEAQHRWLRPAEICEILRNYEKFHIAPEPANRPPNGSLFLFDRKVLRYFRKDGHNWRKKKDGKTVKEAHERLKAGSIDVLHCYYAHGAENENFQRRSYWLLEEELSHIVLVHYREVKGSRTNFNRVGQVEEAIPDSHEPEDALHSEVDSSVSSKFDPYNYQVTSQITDTTSLNSGQASELEDAESAYNHQASSRFHSFTDLQLPVMDKIDGLSVPYYPAPISDNYQGNFPDTPEMDFVSLSQGDKVKNSIDAGLTYEPQKLLDFASWENVFENSGAGYQSVHFQPSLSSTQPGTMSVIPRQGNNIMGYSDDCGKKQEFGCRSNGKEERQASEDDSSNIAKWPMDQKLHSDSAYQLSSRFHEDQINCMDLLDSLEPLHSHPAEQNKHPIRNGPQIQLMHEESGYSLKLDLEKNYQSMESKTDYSALKQPLLDCVQREGLKKLDSFDRWMSKELGDVNQSHTQASSESYWDTVGSEDGVGDSSIAPQEHLDTYMLGLSLSQDQLFSIIDFSPNWAFAGSEVKVLIMGRFLKSRQDVEKCKWACMFGELEVPAEVIANGVLRCHTPRHKAGKVPFYVTSSNRLACSEVREFEYRVSTVQDMDFADINSSENLLNMRFAKLLSLVSVPSNVDDNSEVSDKINSIMKEDNNEWDQMLKFTTEDEFSVEKVKEQLLQKLLKEKLHVWLLHKAAEGGKGPGVLDEGGQGVLHFAAALGYDWAIPPTLAAGVSVNFRDVNGWTALHWAASCGRERTIGFLISLGADPGAVTDPTPVYPSGRTPADLASSNGHKGIAGYLAESALSYHLLALELKDANEGDDGEISIVKAVQTITERTATPVSGGELPHGLSLKDSLAAVCNATQAAARIHQVFRVQSFQQKQLKEYSDGEFGMSDERVLSHIAMKTNNTTQHAEPVHAAAVRIQNKFRSWKGRKEYLIVRQQIVKIQAHVRGHQVRKNYKKIVWSVSILEKVILRWRRKGSGLRGFKPDALTDGHSMQDVSSTEDDYDFLKEGRKQTEERYQKALARVKSMVQYPEARDQYRRLLNVVSEMQETKTLYDRVLNSSEEAAKFDDDLADLEAFLGDDTLVANSILS